MSSLLAVSQHVQRIDISSPHRLHHPAAAAAATVSATDCYSSIDDRQEDLIELDRTSEGPTLNSPHSRLSRLERQRGGCVMVKQQQCIAVWTIIYR